jgi:hypothetical protein
MQPIESHPSDQELLMAADGELITERRRSMEEHLTACWACRARKAEIESAIVDFVHFHRRTLDPQLPPAAGPRALLKARLAERNAAGQQRKPRWFGSFAGTHLLARIGVPAVVLALALLLLSQILVRRPIHAAPILPQASITPGVARFATRQEICAVPPPNNRIVPVSLQRKVFKEYGLSEKDPRAYEVDYLITPALGGADDVRNLWPQSYSGTVWNADAKDALEDRLHELVCQGRVDLATAQHDISSDWIAAYKRYFHTDVPAGSQAR